MTDQEKGHEIIKALVLAIEGTEEKYGLLDILDGYYYGSPDIVNIENLLKEAKLFLAVERVG